MEECVWYRGARMHRIPWAKEPACPAPPEHCVPLPVYCPSSHLTWQKKKFLPHECPQKMQSIKPGWREMWPSRAPFKFGETGKRQVTMT